MFQNTRTKKPNVLKYTGCTLKLRTVRLLFAVFGRLSPIFQNDRKKAENILIHLYITRKKCGFSTKKISKSPMYSNFFKT